MSGKGSQRRPRLVSREQFNENWEHAFGKGKQKLVCCGDCLNWMKMPDCPIESRRKPSEGNVIACPKFKPVE